MITHRFSDRLVRRVALSAWAAAFIAGCTEPRRADRDVVPAQAPSARLELSDSAAAPGTVVRVTVRLTGPAVSSATARIVYDSTGLQFVDEELVDDGATRVVNPQPGLLRFAAIAPNGFMAGRVHALRFMVHRTAALAQMQLVVDEMHVLSGAAAVPSLLRRTP
jgi:hypothetical protein